LKGEKRGEGGTVEDMEKPWIDLAWKGGTFKVDHEKKDGGALGFHRRGRGGGGKRSVEMEGGKES